MSKSSVYDRMCAKSAEQSLLVELCTQYALPPVAAEALLRRINRYVDEKDISIRASGQVVLPAVSVSEPAGKPIRSCKLTDVTLTVDGPEDVRIFHEQGAVALRQHRVLRMLAEAHFQGGLLSQEDLARLLAVDISTIKRIFARLRKSDVRLPSRGQIKDIGRATSHKVEAIRNYVHNFDLAEVGLRLGNHGLESIARYIRHFALVAVLSDKEVPVIQICRVCRISESLVREYTSLYRELDTPENQTVLERIKGLYSNAEDGILPEKKGGWKQ